MAHKTSSFTPKARVKTPNLPGTLPSLHNNLLLVSTGVPSVDKVIDKREPAFGLEFSPLYKSCRDNENVNNGMSNSNYTNFDYGCLPIGTVLLIEEDKYQCYSKVLAKYYLAEGVTCGHDILVASADDELNSFVKELPSPIEIKKNETKGPAEELKIAWRYQSLDSAGPANLSKLEFNRNFDLTKRLPSEVVEKASIKTIDLSISHFLDHNLLSENSTKFDYVFSCICRHIDERGFSNSSEQLPSTVLRVLIQSAGSPLWSTSNSSHLESAFLCFLFLLRAKLRSAVATCMITVPTFLWEDSNFIRRLHHLCDTVVRLESFAASSKETNPVFKDYHGLFHVEKLPRLNSLLAHTDHPEDLAFKLGKRKFLVEKLCLPPLFDDEDKGPGLSFCSSKTTSGLKKHLEF